MEADQSDFVKAQGAVTTQIKQPHALSVGTTEASTTWENKDALLLFSRQGLTWPRRTSNSLCS